MSRPSTAPSSALVEIDYAKGIAILVIVCSHLCEQFGANPSFFNPSVGWPSFGEQIAAFVAPAGPGVLGIVGALLRDVAEMGDPAVGLFILLSGLGLGWSMTLAGRLDLPAYARRRIGRIYPMWLTAHLLFALPLVLASGVAWSAAAFSALGIRFLPATYYAIVPAWWFVGLLLQLYAIAPLLWFASRRFGAGRTLAVAIAVGLASRAVGLPLAGHYVDEWSRGAIFVTRLPEFALGFALAILCRADPATLRDLVGSRKIRSVAAFAFVAGILASMSLTGMVFAPLLTTAGGYVLVAGALTGRRLPILGWTGRHSYSIYLVHQIPIMLLLRHPHGYASSAALIVASLVSGLALALALEWLTGRLGHVMRVGGPRLALASAAALLVVLYGTETAVRALDPQEAFGAGERPSLIADPAVTYKLKPNATTHLRWQSYDYYVHANSLGFPAPEPPTRHPTGVTTVMSLGNAFTSAEGVNTPESWPRLLQRDDPRFLVSDFAVTGHGPNQWAEVVHTYGPRVKPDVIVVQMWVKDFNDALLSDDAMRASIGFGLPAANSPKSFLQLVETRAWIKNRVIGPVLSTLEHRPDPIGYDLGGFRFLLRSNEQVVDTLGYQATRADIRRIRDDAARWGGRVVLAMFPASIQVCSRGQLPYYPRFVDFPDPARYDPDLPQRLATKLAADLHVGYIDVRPAFRGACDFAPHNMHLTLEGQRAAGAYLARELAPLTAQHVSAR